MANETKEEGKKRALVVLASLPENFRYGCDGMVLGKNDIQAFIAGGSDFGQRFVELTAGASPVKGSNALGKRRLCVVCGTEALCTKAGDGNVNCCGQPMWVKEPRPIPSSD